MKRHLNLMSPQARRREILRRARHRWSCVLAAVLVLLLPIGGARWWSYFRVEQRRAAASAKYDPIRQLRAESARMQQRIATLDNDQRTLLTLAQERPVVALMGLTGDAIAKQAGAIYVGQLELEQHPLAGDQPENSVLLLEGAAREARAVERLVESLRRRGPFANVEYRSREVNEVGGQRVYQFSVECVY